MKKDTLKKVVAGVMLTSTLGAVACFSEGKPTVKEFEVSGNGAVYQVDDSFSLSGYKLKLIMSDGTEKEVSLTDNMIVTAPDMSTSGEKTVKVSYNGAEYTFTINVGGYSKAELLTKLQEFKEAYNAAKKAGDTKVKLDINLTGKLLGDSGSVSLLDENAPSFSLTEEDAKIDSLSEHLYSSLITSLVNSGLDSTELDIINSNQLKVKMDYLRTLTNIYNEIVDYDYFDYLFEEILFQKDVDYVKGLTESLVTFFEINQIGERALEDLLRINISHLKNRQEIDVLTELGKLNTIIQTYSDSIYIKEATQIVYNKVQDLDKNILSSFIKEIAKSDTYNLVPSLKVYGDFAEDGYDGVDSKGYYRLTEIPASQTEYAIQMTDRYVTNIANIIEQVENYIANIYENKSFDASAHIEQIKNICDDIEVVGQAFQDNDWLGTAYGFEYFGVMGDIAGQFEGNYLKWVADILDKYEITSTFVNLIPENVLSENMKSVLIDLVYDILANVTNENPEYDYESYIDRICAEYNITDTDVIQGFKDEFETNKTFSIVSYILVEYANVFAEDNVAWGEPLVDLIKYIEQLPVSIKAQGEDKFTWDNLLTKVKVLTDAVLNNVTVPYWVGFEYDEDTGSRKDVYESVRLIDISGYEDMADRNSGVYVTKETLLIISNLTNTENSFAENVQNYVEQSKLDLIEMGTDIVASLLKIDIWTEENVQTERAKSAVKSFVNLVVNDYISNRLDAVVILSDLLNLIDTYCSNDMKTVANSIALTTVVFLGKDCDIDFNEVFKDVELPEAIKSIDYNKLIDKIWDEETYTKAIKLNDVEIQYVTNNENVITKQIMTLKLGLDFDVMIASVLGDVVLTFEIDF